MTERRQTRKICLSGMFFVFGVIVSGMKGGEVMLGLSSIESLSKVSKKEKKR